LGTLKRVALVRLDALGDTLLTTPALRLLLEQLPEADVLALTHPVGSPILRPLCSVAEVSPRDSWRSLGRRLAAFQPDAVFCCSEKRRAGLATWASGAPLRVGFDPGWSQPLKSLAARALFHRTVPIDNNPARASVLHEAERYVRLVAAGLDSPAPRDVPPLLLAPPPHYYTRQGWVHLRPIRVGVQLSAKWCRSGYTVEHLRGWVASLPGPKLGFVAPNEQRWAARHFGDFPVACTSDILEYATWLQQLEVLVTIDTGAAHVAAALQIPVVDVFPEPHHQHTVPRWKPWKCRHRIVLQPPFSAAGVTRVGEELRAAVDDLLKCGDGSAPET
jgi:ADP-heptose:LPS heptosyltransferase